jgi:hypothetical protein
MIRKKFCLNWFKFESRSTSIDTHRSIGFIIIYTPCYIKELIFKAITQTFIYTNFNFETPYILVLKKRDIMEKIYLFSI